VERLGWAGGKWAAGRWSWTVGGTRDGLSEGARWAGPRGLREAGRVGDGFGPFFLSFFIFFSHA
jgi:hypothetical protein